MKIFWSAYSKLLKTVLSYERVVNASIIQISPRVTCPYNVFVYLVLKML